MAARPGTVGIVVGAVLTIVGGVPLVLLVFMVISARLGPASDDPHGYVVIFGTVYAAICALPTLIGVAILVPSIIRRRQHSNDRVQS